MKKKLLITFASVVIICVGYTGIMATFIYSGGKQYQENGKLLPGNEKTVALTFDDGPNPGETEKLLGVLDRLNIKATFFVNGKHVKQHPELLTAIYERGHGIGNHSWSHQMLPHLAISSPREEVISTNKIIKKTIGIEPTLFRAPFLVSGRGLTSAVQELNMQPVGGIGTNDWEEPSSENIADNIVQQVKPGSIIVLHDGDASSTEQQPQGDRNPTIDAIEIIAKELRAKGYHFALPEELLTLNSNK